jgi:hypothetical protein
LLKEAAGIQSQPLLQAQHVVRGQGKVELPAAFSEAGHAGVAGKTERFFSRKRLTVVR